MKLQSQRVLQSQITLKLSNRKAAHSFAPRPLIFKLKQEVLKFNDIYMS